MKPSDEFLIKLSNLWFFDEEPENDISDTMKRFFIDVVEGLRHGEDAVYSHPKIAEIIQHCKDFGIFDYGKNIMEIYYEGRIRAQIEYREFMKKQVNTVEFNALMNILGNMADEYVKNVKTKIEEEKNISAIPTLTNCRTFEN